MIEWTVTCCGACFLEEIAGWKDGCEALRHTDVEEVFWTLHKDGYLAAKHVSIDSTGITSRTARILRPNTDEEARRRLLAQDAVRRLVA